jgi:cytochrome bd-type quinol oxidase subunit 2
VIVAICLLVAVSALVSRVRDRGLTRAFRMPQWPLPPLVAVVGVIIALTQQASRDLWITFGIGAVSFAGYFLARRRLPGRLAGDLVPDTTPGAVAAAPGEGAA